MKADYDALFSELGLGYIFVFVGFKGVCGQAAIDGRLSVDLSPSSRPVIPPSQ